MILFYIALWMLSGIISYIVLITLTKTCYPTVMIEKFKENNINIYDNRILINVSILGGIYAIITILLIILTVILKIIDFFIKHQ